MNFKFDRGFKNVLKKASRMKPYIADCKSCVFFDAEEGCSNSEVTSYDMVNAGDRTFCCFWRPCEEE